MEMVFKPAPAGFISEKEAQRYGERLFLLQEQNGGKLDAKIVVNDARNIQSPLHDYFMWDDTEAAEKWREQQARVLIGNIHIVIKMNEKEESVRAFQHINVVINDKKESSYINTIDVLNNPQLRKQMVERALIEFNSLRRKYKQYQELAEIFMAIERAEEQLKMKIESPILEMA